MILSKQLRAHFRLQNTLRFTTGHLAINLTGCILLTLFIALKYHIVDDFSWIEKFSFEFRM